ncbi:hypothetical protein [Nocardia sp. NPDC058666]
MTASVPPDLLAAYQPTRVTAKSLRHRCNSPQLSLSP